MPLDIVMNRIEHICLMAEYNEWMNAKLYDMNEKKLVTLDQLREFLAATSEVEFQGCGQDDER